jgi:hypothetical protein
MYVRIVYANRTNTEHVQLSQAVYLYSGVLVIAYISECNAHVNQCVPTSSFRSFNWHRLSDNYV